MRTAEQSEKGCARPGGIVRTRRNGGHRAIAFGVFASLLFITPAAADIATACAGTSTFPDAVTQLESEGWTVLTRDSDLTEAQVDALAWTLMTGYLAGDDGGEDIATLLDLQRRSAPGLLARRDTDTTKSRVLTDDDSVLTIVQTRTLPGRVERICRFATTGNAAADAPVGLTIINTTEVDGAPETLAEIATVLTEETKP